MLEFNKIQLSDKQTINKIRTSSHNKLSALTFANIFCWQEIQDLTVYIGDNFFVIKLLLDKTTSYQLCGDIDECVRFVRKIINLNQDFEITHIIEDFKDELIKSIPELNIVEDRNNFDYIERISDLSNLQGKKFKTIRKEINSYINNNLEVKQIEFEDIEKIKLLVKKWNLNHNSENHNYFADTKAELFALDYYFDLELKGIVIKNNGQYVSMAIASEINEEIVDVHFSKCIDELKGSDYYCKHMFCKMFESEYKYMNMEEDMGIEGLRIRKKLFNPCSMNIVYKGIYENGK